MQRLSIDASASKLQSYDINDSKRKESLSSPPPPSSSSSSAADYDDHDLKDVKLRRLSSPHQKRENLVHFIPVLTLICFVILYLSSHAPSQSDLAQFNGFMRSSKRLESDEDGEISGLMIGTDASAAIRSSIRKLRVTESLPRRRTSHRKTADF
ncbi:BnaC04g44400D [Brassica napus]|uniref:BnaC04g44400D protein n=1 Tax=Brassica napus TaxID=3708 RepID=A0A078H2W1_BRANA|nr:BnaC04g44400D [Brassica napus]